jgi:hypothetical protein
MSEVIRLYGTLEPPAISDSITIGQLSFTLEEGALRHIRVGSIEIIRCIAFLVRDRDWGTLTPRLSLLSSESTDTSFSLHLEAEFETPTATLDVSIFVEALQDKLTMRAEGIPNGIFETNRAGFTVLHPATLAGRPVSVEHSDSSIEASTFPFLIDPWQPFKDIKAITHFADGLAVDCTFTGDTFEMEDQRQWGDASYKTYVRPLALPWPYTLSRSQPLTQSVSISWNRTNKRQPKNSDPCVLDEALFPETAILLTPKDAVRLIKHPADIRQVSPQRLLCNVDTTTGAITENFEAYAKLQAVMPHFVYDLELICGFEDPPELELVQVRAAMDAAGFKPESVMLCPAVDRISTPPGSDWPKCPPLEEIHCASANTFVDLIRGGGMVTFFPELNRKRPPLEKLDFVSHSLCPIVHASDDLSVMETLEVIPHIIRSARAIIGDAEYRIGPSTIAMRHNPYGQRTFPNPDLSRLCMADNDPRHGAAFGAAYVIGLATALADSGVTVWTPSELYGPRGLYGPITKAISLLASCAGKSVHRATIKNDLAELVIGSLQITANLTSQPFGGLGPFEFKTS